MKLICIYKVRYINQISTSDVNIHKLLECIYEINIINKAYIKIMYLFLYMKERKKGRDKQRKNEMVVLSLKWH